MTDKHKTFIKEYLLSGNATSAARSAGYSDANAANTGCRLLKNEEIKREIERRREKAETAAPSRILSPIEIKQYLSDLSVSAAKESDRIRALELLARINNMLTDRQDITHEIMVDKVDSIKGATLEELQRIINGT